MVAISLNKADWEVIESTPKKIKYNDHDSFFMIVLYTIILLTLLGFLKTLFERKIVYIAGIILG